MKVMTQLLGVFERHRGKSVGLIVGFLVSILLLTLGFFKTIFIVGCSTLGFFIGSKIDKHEDFRDLIDRILPPHD